MEIMDDPYPSTPGEQEALIAEVRDRVKSLQIPADLMEVLSRRADGFVERVISLPPLGTHFYGGQLGWTSWVIRNDHLDLVAGLAPVASAIATYATAVSGANPITLAITLIFAMATVGRKLRSKSANLDLVDYNILMALKQVGAGSPRELALILNGVRIYGPDLWNEERVLEALRRLQGVRLGDGSVEALVTELSDGRWSTNGI
jgi:hypothetical protein